MQLRLLSPVVLGLGGWMLGVLIVLTTMSGISLDNTLVATLSTGLPNLPGHLPRLGES